MPPLRARLAALRARLSPRMAAIVVFLGPVVGRVNGAAIPDELVKAARAYLAVGTLAGGASAALVLLAADAPLVFTGSLASALVAALLTRLADHFAHASLPAPPTAVTILGPIGPDDSPGPAAGGPPP